MEPNEKLFFSLLRSTLNEASECAMPTDADFNAVYTLAKRHDLSHLLAQDSENGGRIGDRARREAFEKQRSLAVFRQAKKELAMEELRAVLNTAKIAFVLLKGTALMRLYPQAWMRTSSDIDVLVREEDLERAVSAFTEAGMHKTVQTAHDVSFFSNSNYHIELHYTLIEQERYPQMVEVLKTVWDYAIPISSDGFEYELRDEMLYYYHIAHMLKHFEMGGCGIRAFLDLWLLNHKTAHDPLAREKLLEQGGVLRFAQMAEKLSECWFSGAEEDPDLVKLERFVLDGGAFGNVEQLVVVRKNQTGGRIAYYLRRIFPPRHLLFASFPVLKKLPILLPLVWFVRLFRLLDPKTRKKILNEIQVEKHTDEARSREISNMMDSLGLQ